MDLLFLSRDKMIQKIVSGYGRLLLSLLKILALVALCALFAFTLVLPLWKFASAAPQAYSVTALLLFAVGIVFFTGKSLRNYLVAGFPTPQQRRRRIRHIFTVLGRILVIIAGLAGTVACILSESAIAAWVVLLTTIILYGVLTFGTKKERHS